MAVNVNLHDVTRENGDTWFVTKEIIVTDDSDKEVLKVTLFADGDNEIVFNEIEEV